MIKYVKTIRTFQIEDRCHIFDSYCVTNDKQIHHFTRYKSLANSWAEGSKIYHNVDIYLGEGEDPRPFVLRNHFGLHAVTYMGGYGWLNSIYLSERNQWYAVWLPQDMRQGKNWSPFVVNNQLFFIHEFSPFRIITVGFDATRSAFVKASVVAERPLLVAKSGSDNYSILRGGSNGIQLRDGSVVGFGHTNFVDSIGFINHRPFIWKIDASMTIGISEIPSDVLDVKYRLVDPTSLFEFDNQYWLVTCEAEKHWGLEGPNRGRICLYRVSL